jgi:hypothetical protein
LTSYHDESGYWFALTIIVTWVVLCALAAGYIETLKRWH